MRIILIFMLFCCLICFIKMLLIYVYLALSMQLKSGDSCGENGREKNFKKIAKM